MAATGVVWIRQPAGEATLHLTTTRQSWAEFSLAAATEDGAGGSALLTFSKVLLLAPFSDGSVHIWGEGGRVYPVWIRHMVAVTCHSQSSQAPKAYSALFYFKRVC